MRRQRRAHFSTDEMTASTQSERISSFMSQFLMRAYCIVRLSASRLCPSSSSAIFWERDGGLVTARVVPTQPTRHQTTTLPEGLLLVFYVAAP